MTSDLTVEKGRPWRGLSPVERREARRRRLLEAALELFGTTGYAGTSLTALCSLAGVSPRHFYDIHPGREQLLAELYDEIAADIVGRLRRAQAAAPQNVQDQVHAGLEAVVSALADDPRRARVLLVEIVGVSGPLDALRRQWVRRFSEVICQSHTRLVTGAGLPPRDVAAVAVGLVGAINELLTDWLLTDPRPEASSVLPPLSLILTAVFELQSCPD